jgi:hypothetical protein
MFGLFIQQSTNPEYKMTEKRQTSQGYIIRILGSVGRK